MNGKMKRQDLDREIKFICFGLFLFDFIAVSIL